MRFFYLILFLFSACGSFAESWTNSAGHAVEAELISRKVDMLTMKRSDGTTFSIHLKALSKACQANANKKIPQEQKVTHNEIVKQRQEQRMRQLRAEEESVSK